MRRPKGGGTGVIVAQGVAFGGWVLYDAHGEKLKYCHNFVVLQRSPSFTSRVA
jgi:hypothetical protein